MHIVLTTPFDCGDFGDNCPHVKLISYVHDPLRQRVRGIYQYGTDTAGDWAAGMVPKASLSLSDTDYTNLLADGLGGETEAVAAFERALYQHMLDEGIVSGTIS